MSNAGTTGPARSSPLAIAVVGSGRMARRHIEAYRTLGGPATVVYVVNPRGADELAAWSGAVACGTLEEAVRDPSVGLVDICTPPTAHRQLVVSALQSGTDVLVEKPIALDLDDAAAIVEAGLVSTRFVMVAHVVRFFPAYRAVQASVSRGEVGGAHTVRARRLSPHPVGLAWVDDEAASGGAIVDLMVHDFDQANAYLGQARSVFARRGSEKGPVEVLVEYYGGGVGAVEGSWWMPDSHPFVSSLEVHGDLGTATATVGEGTTAVLYPATAHARPLPVSGPEGFEAQAAYALDCVRSRVAPKIGTARQGFDALAVALAARASLATGRVEPVRTLPAANP